MLIWLILLIIIVFCDQLTKWLAIILLEDCTPHYLIDGVLRFSYVENRGAAFGMLDEHRWVFLVLSTAAIIGICVYVCLKPPKSRLVMISLTLIAGGGIGNMIDRTFLGYVVDFIDFCAFPKLWKWVFNVADSCICVGVGLLILYLIIDTVKEVRAEKANKKVSPDEIETRSDGDIKND
ncbi:MAG: signal peptidase II [Clostridia bacterium]|nr:signal peptidase II [Clostridia bacterium]